MNSKNATSHKKSISKGKIITVFVIIIAVLIISSSAFFINRIFVNRNGEPGSFETVMKVNGEPVTYGEFKHYIEANRSLVYTYFRNKYGAEDNEAFWTTAYGEEIPLKEISKLAIRDSVRRKVIQIMAKKNGLVEDISYTGLLRDLNSRNKERQEKVKNNEVIYGPVTLDEQRFLDEELNNLERDLKDKLKGSFYFSSEDYKNYYENNKQQFSLGYSRTIRAICASFSGETDKEEKFDLVRTRIEIIKKEIDSGVEFDVIYNEILNSSDEFLTTCEKVYDYTLSRMEAVRNPILITEINNLEPGQVTGIIEQENSIGIYKCVEKKDLGYIPLENAKKRIENELVELKFKELVEMWIKDANVEIDENKIQRIKM